MKTKSVYVCVTTVVSENASLPMNFEPMDVPLIWLLINYIADHWLFIVIGIAINKLGCCLISPQ